MQNAAAVNPSDDRADLMRRGRLLEYFTVGWNVVEAVVSVTAGVIAGSTALIGFGVDSLIESSSGVVLLWRLRHGEQGERREKIAHRLVGASLLLLAGYVAIDAGHALLAQEPPDESVVGIVLAVVSLIVMPVLARAKRKVAAALSSNALHADSKQTDICAYLSAILLLGLGLNAWLDWWWADPVAALAMTPIILHEAVNGLRGKGCACAGEPGN